MHHHRPCPSLAPDTFHHLRLHRLRRRLLGVDLLAILVEPDPGRWVAVTTTFARTNTKPRISILNQSRSFETSTREKERERECVCVCAWYGMSLVLKGRDIPHDLAVDGARDTVLELKLHIGYGVYL